MAFAACCCTVYWYCVSHWVVNCCSELVLAGMFAYIIMLKFLHTAQISSWQPLILAYIPCRGTLFFFLNLVFIMHYTFLKNIWILFPFLKAFFFFSELHRLVQWRIPLHLCFVAHCYYKNFTSQSDFAVFKFNSSFSLPFPPFFPPFLCVFFLCVCSSFSHFTFVSFFSSWFLRQGFTL